MRIEEPTFSIIIPTYRRPDALRVCVQALCELDYPRSGFEVIIVDDGGTVPLQPLLEPFADSLRMKILWQPNAGPAAARNSGALQATGDLLAFTDDDCTPASSWLRGFAAAFTATPTALLGDGQSMRCRTTPIPGQAS